MDQQTKYDLLKTEFLITREQMNKYDTLSTTAKGWLVTLWAASIGWSFQVRRKEIVALSVFITAIFWILDSFTKTYRQNYKKRRDEISAALKNYFVKGEVPTGFVAPQPPVHRVREIIGNGLRMRVLLLYLLLALASLIVYFINSDDARLTPPKEGGQGLFTRPPLKLKGRLAQR